MKIHFLGTGAADWDWSKPLSKKVRGSTSTLLDGKILIDAGKTAWENLQRCGIDPAEVSHLLITHSHGDHFDPGTIRRIAEAPGRTEKLHVYASPEAVSRLGRSGMKTTKLAFGKRFSILGSKFETLFANHLLEDEKEDSFHFLITTPEKKRLLYALDGGWMTSRARMRLGRAPIHMIIWDATSGTSINDWRFADHNDLEMIRSMRLSLAALGLVNDETVHVFDHIARTLWPDSAAKRKQAAKQYGGILANDGDVLNL